MSALFSAITDIWKKIYRTFTGLNSRASSYYVVLGFVVRIQKRSGLELLPFGRKHGDFDQRRAGRKAGLIVDQAAAGVGGQRDGGFFRGGIWRFGAEDFAIQWGEALRFGDFPDDFASGVGGQGAIRLQNKNGVTCGLRREAGGERFHLGGRIAGDFDFAGHVEQHFGGGKFFNTLARRHDAPHGDERRTVAHIFERDRRKAEAKRARGNIVPRGFADEDLPAAGGAFDAVGDVDGVADDGEFDFLHGADVAGADFAGVEADAVGEAAGREREARAGGFVAVEFEERDLHFEAGGDGVRGVIGLLVKHTPHGHDLIAGAFIDGAAAAENQLLHDAEIAVKETYGVFGRHVGGHRRKAADVGVKDGAFFRFAAEFGFEIAVEQARGDRRREEALQIFAARGFFGGHEGEFDVADDQRGLRGQQTQDVDIFVGENFVAEELNQAEIFVAGD